MALKKSSNKKKLLIIGLSIIVVIGLIFFFWPGHAPYEFITKILGIQSPPQGTQGQISQRNDFGCFYSCDFFPEGFPKQMCNDWKAGKSVNWPSDCSMMQYGPCIKLCESENQKNSAQPTNSNVSGLYGGNGGQTSNSQELQKPNIPKSDPNAENVYIYFTDFKHSRIIRIDDMTGKNWISFGSNGSGVNQFNQPNHFFVQSDGHIYVADQLNHRIVRIDDMTGKGWVSYGSQGMGSGQFQEPASIRLDKNGKIYIVDTGNCRIIRIDDITGKGWTQYGRGGGGENCGHPTTQSGEFDGPKDIAFDSQGRIYISDDFDQRIVRIDDMTGKGWVTYGTGGLGVGQFLQPQSITIDAQDRIYITDEDKNTQGGHVVRIDDMTGTGWTAFPSVSPDSKLALPHDTYISASGHLYIADTRNNAVVRIDDIMGKNYISYAPCANCQQGTDIHQLEAPKGIFVVQK